MHNNGKAAFVRKEATERLRISGALDAGTMSKEEAIVQMMQFGGMVRWDAMRYLGIKEEDLEFPSIGDID